MGLEGNHPGPLGSSPTVTPHEQQEAGGDRSPTCARHVPIACRALDVEYRKWQSKTTYIISTPSRKTNRRTVLKEASGLVGKFISMNTRVNSSSHKNKTRMRKQVQKQPAFNLQTSAETGGIQEGTR